MFDRSREQKRRNFPTAGATNCCVERNATTERPHCRSSPFIQTTVRHWAKTGEKRPLVEKPVGNDTRVQEGSGDTGVDGQVGAEPKEGVFVQQISGQAEVKISPELQKRTSVFIDLQMVRPRRDGAYPRDKLFSPNKRDAIGYDDSNPIPEIDHTIILQARLKNSKERLSELEGMVQMEKKAVESLKVKRNKIRAFILHVLQTLLKNPVEALDYEISVKTIVKYLQDIGENPNPEMMGGAFTAEEKNLIIGLALMQNQWAKAKAYLQLQKKLDLLESKESVVYF